MNTMLRRLFILNPLFEEATRARRKFFRTAGGPGRGLSIAIVGIAGLVYVWLLAEIMISRGGIGQVTFILFAQLTLVTLFMPISVYGAISGERERTTWEALILTRLTHGQIVVGKLVWRIAGLVILMAFFLLPILVSISYSMDDGQARPLGGMIFNSEQNQYISNSVWSFICRAEVMTFTWGFSLCAYGLWVSANTRKSVTSAALIFVSLLTVLLLLPILFNMIGGPMLEADYSGNYGTWVLMHINSFYALSRMTGSDGGGYDSSDGGPDPLHGNEWGMLQSGVYTAGAIIFIYATYRTLKLWEEHKNRIG
jgi:hypothetical protein